MERPAAIVLAPVLVIVVIKGDLLSIQRGDMASPVLQVEARLLALAIVQGPCHLIGDVKFRVLFQVGDSEAMKADVLVRAAVRLIQLKQQITADVAKLRVSEDRFEHAECASRRYRRPAWHNPDRAAP